MPAQPTHTHTHTRTHPGPFYETTLTFLNPESGNHGATVTFDKEYLPVSEGGTINGEASYSLVYTSQGYIGGATSERAYICEPYVENDHEERRDGRREQRRDEYSSNYTSNA